MAVKKIRVNEAEDIFSKYRKSPQSNITPAELVTDIQVSVDMDVFKEYIDKLFNYIIEGFTVPVSYSSYKYRDFIRVELFIEQDSNSSKPFNPLAGTTALCYVICDTETRDLKLRVEISSDYFEDYTITNNSMENKISYPYNKLSDFIAEELSKFL